MHDTITRIIPIDVSDPNSGQAKQNRRSVVQARGLSRPLRQQQQDFKRSRAPQLRRAAHRSKPDAARSRSKSPNRVPQSERKTYLPFKGGRQILDPETSLPARKATRDALGFWIRVVIDDEHETFG